MAGGRTFAEMRPEEKNAISHRARALRPLARFLAEARRVERAATTWYHKRGPEPHTQSRDGLSSVLRGWSLSFADA